ncbi:DUF2288 domain-containing protein [Massilia sp. W12]|uniref:DUF2288 domain-containing protein n=1 Tax=Massilia sp. W12 TaxID=3126507 RepID=UPI0030CD1CDC
MHDYKIDPAQALKARLNQETARLPFAELLRYYAAGSVIKVANQLDLVDVAVQFALDKKEQVAAWMQAGQVQRASDADGARWQAQDAALWAVVVSPWVLVQEEKPAHLGHTLQ